MAPVPQPPPRIPGDLIRGGRTVFLGDSVTLMSSLPQKFADNSYATWLALNSGGRVRSIYNAGVAGERSDQILLRVQSDVIANKADRCIIVAGTNDVGQSVTLPTILANINAIVNTLRGAKIEPILGTIPPRVSFLTQQNSLNAAILHYADHHGLHCIDFHSVLVDATSGLYASGMDDGGSPAIHPSVAGAKAMGNLAWTTLQNIYPPAPAYLSKCKPDGASLLTNGTFQGDSNSDGTADTWTKAGTAGGTPTLVTGDSNIKGNWQQLVSSDTSNNRYFSSTMSAGFSPGDRIAFSGLLDTSSITGTIQVTPRLRATGGVTTDFEPVRNLSQAVTRSAFYIEATLPAGTTTLEVQLNVLGQVTAKFAQITVVNLTALGVA